MPYHKLMSILALVIIFSVVSVEVTRFLLHRHSKAFARKIRNFTSTRWTRSQSGSLIEKEYLGQRIDHDEERTMPCYAEELANLLQFKLFTSSTQHMSEICQKYFDLEMLHNKGRYTNDV